MNPEARSQDSSPFISAAIPFRLNCLEEFTELLTCLAAQDCDDFEVVVVCSTNDEAACAENALHMLSPSLRKKARILYSDAASPNSVLPALSGQYAVLLPCDTLVADNWVSTLRRAAWEQPGEVVRCFASRQAWAHIDAPMLDERALISVGPVEAAYCSPLNCNGLARQNPIPPASWALPLFAFRDFGLQACGSNEPQELWALFVAASRLCGLHQIEETAVLERVWPETPIMSSARENHASTTRCTIRKMIPPEVMEPLRRLRRKAATIRR